MTTVFYKTANGDHVVLPIVSRYKDFEIDDIEVSIPAAPAIPVWTEEMVAEAHRLGAELTTADDATAPEASEELKQAFRLAYDAYSTPADKYNGDLDYIVFLRTKITACFSILQKLVYPK